MASQSLTTTDGVPFLRPDDGAFQNLPDYAFAPHYLDFEGLRLHYIDEGPRDGPVALLMHGMPTWSFLNRHIIKTLAAAGWRCIAADHIGFGRSDKVTEPGWYSIARHTAAHRQLVEELDLNGVTLFAQDWGGPIGLAQAAEMPERFERLVIMNTWLHNPDFEYSPGVRQWQAGWQTGGLFDTHIGGNLSFGWFVLVAFGLIPARAIYAMVQQGEYPALDAATDSIRRGYDAPYAGQGRDIYAGPRRFPLSIPIDQPQAETAQTQARHYAALLCWQKPIHFIWGGKDDVFTESWGRQWAANYRQATFDLLPDAGHFPQETHGVEIARLFLGYVAG